MADLTAGVDSPYRGDRAQIILIAAFTLAVAFVALALVVNSAIFTENLASRGEVAGSSEALLYQHQVRESVGDAMAFANVYNHSSDAKLENSLETSTGEIGIQGGSQQVLGGQVANVTLNTPPEYGYRLVDNDSGGSTFHNESGAEVDYILAKDVENVRNFQIEVASASSLATSASSALTIEANDSGDVWELQVYQDGSEVITEVDHPDVASSKECQSASSPAGHTIDVTGAILDGKRCHALASTGSSSEPMWWGTGIGDEYDIWIKNGHNVQGNYSLVAGQGGSVSPESDNLASGPNDGDPFSTNAIYSADVDYVFATPNVVYEADLRVAPGEVPP